MENFIFMYENFSFMPLNRFKEKSRDSDRSCISVT